MSYAPFVFAPMWFIVIALAGALGSFANVLIFRLPLMMGVSSHELATSNKLFNIALPASFCPLCHQPLKWWHNIPILSFLILRARCAHCAGVIPTRYFWVELGALVWAGLSVYWFGFSALAFACFVFLYILWVASWIDALHYLLLDVLTYSLLIIGFVAQAVLNRHGAVDGLIQALMGVLLGYLLLWLPYIVYLKWRGIEGLGLGDCKLLAGVGAWLGVAAVPNVLLYASVMALLMGALFSWVQRSDLRMYKLAFGPFIAAGALLELLVSQTLF